MSWAYQLRGQANCVAKAYLQARQDASCSIEALVDAMEEARDAQLFPLSTGHKLCPNLLLPVSLRVHVLICPCLQSPRKQLHRR